MAIIIVAILLTLIAICSYIAYCIKDVREEEKGFYDILFFTKFFQEIFKNQRWNTFIRKGAIIYVTRNMLIEEKNIDFDVLNIGKENIFDITSSDDSDKVEVKNAYLWYEFKTDSESISFATKVSAVHIKLLKFLKNTIIICTIDKNAVKMTLNGSVESVMYISSIESICQNLALILQNQEINFREKHNWIRYFFNEVYETFRIVEEIKKLLKTYDSIIRKGFRKA